MICTTRTCRLHQLTYTIIPVLYMSFNAVEHDDQPGHYFTKGIWQRIQGVFKDTNIAGPAKANG